MANGQCQCGAVQFTVGDTPLHHALCHCRDCQLASGAPVVGWYAVLEADLTVTVGEPREYASSEHGRRQFCGTCGTGLFYRNADALPGIVDVQSALLDDIAGRPPQVQIQVAERIGWIADMAALPAFDRYPPMD